MTDEIRIKHEELVTLIAETLASIGVPSPVRDVEAEVTAESDLLGVPSHGIRLLPRLVQGIREGRATPNPDLKVLREREATCVLDGDNGPGRYVSVRAMQMAVERATKFGVGVCLATRVAHWGRAHAYAYRTALAGMIGICTTNAMPSMAAWNSARPLLGNNPLAIGVPCDPDPIIVDMAMTQAAVGTIGTYLREGKKVPFNWGVDSSGQPTDDPAAILASRRLMPFGGHKGAGLAMMLELLTSALAGAPLSHEIAQADPSGLDPDSTKLFLAINIQAFVEEDRFAERVQDYLSYLDIAELGLPITYPGERGWQTRDRYLAEGIPIHGEILEQLKAIGVKIP